MAAVERLNALMIPFTKESVQAIINELNRQFEIDAGKTKNPEHDAFTPADRMEDAYARPIYGLEMLRRLIDSVGTLDAALASEKQVILELLDDAIEEFNEAFQHFLETH